MQTIKKYKIGIVGLGMVGGSLRRYFEKRDDISFYAYDINGTGSLSDVCLADYIYVCVPTPVGDSGACDTSIVEDIVSKLEGSKTIVIKSTVIPGTTDRLQEQYPQHKFLFNPEFLTESTADQDMCYPDRQIVGYTDKSYIVAGDILQQLPLAPFERIVKASEAEMAKYYNNVWFSTKVIVANQFYDICQASGIDYDVVKDLASADKRVGRTHLDIWHKGSRGYGGKCLPKDTKALIEFADSIGVDAKLFKVVEDINNNQLKPNK